MEAVEQHPVDEVGNAQWDLEAITFRRDARGRKAWQQWAARHASEGRAAWNERAVSELRELVARDPAAAKRFLDKAVYRWNDPFLLPDMERLADYRALHNEIVGWINLTYQIQYQHHPALRERFRSLAERIRRESEGALEEWTRPMMRGWDFLYEDKTTWEEFIRRQNMRV